MITTQDLQNLSLEDLATLKVRVENEFNKRRLAALRAHAASFGNSVADSACVAPALASKAGSFLSACASELRKLGRDFRHGS